MKLPPFSFDDFVFPGNTGTPPGATPFLLSGKKWEYPVAFQAGGGVTNGHEPFPKPPLAFLDFLKLPFLDFLLFQIYEINLQKVY